MIKVKVIHVQVQESK